MANKAVLHMEGLCGRSSLANVRSIQNRDGRVLFGLADRGAIPWNHCRNHSIWAPCWGGNLLVPYDSIKNWFSIL